MNNVLPYLAFIGLVVLLVVARKNEIADIESQLLAMNKARLAADEQRVYDDKVDAAKYKDAVDHDSNPNTGSYPVVMDVTKSYDPDAGDKLKFSWVQTSGETVKLSSNKGNVVSFDAPAGEYSFQVTASDNYGESTTLDKTVQIGNEPNESPVVILDIRKGTLEK